MIYACDMGTPVLVFLGVTGLALAALLTIASKLDLRGVETLRKAACIVASLVGIGLLVAGIIVYSFGADQSLSALQNSLLDIEGTLRHWFHSLSLR